MSRTTETLVNTSSRIGTSQTMILWSIVVAGAIIFPSFFFASYRTITFHSFFLSPLPWVHVGGWTIDHGLQMFSGKTLELPTVAERVGCLSSIVLMFIVFPTLFFFGLRKRAVERATGKEYHIIRWSSLGLVVGGIGVMALALTSIPIAFIQQSVSSDLRAAQAKQQNKDAIINELNTIAWKLYEYRILPKELGGGNGVLEGFTIQKERSSTAEAIYQCTIQDTLVIIKATSIKHPLGYIIVTISKKGKLSDWTYSAFFE
jgi:hypothetical protein